MIPLLLFVALTLTQKPPAPPSMTLPTGVVRVTFGGAQHYKDTLGKPTCAIVNALPAPVVFKGVREIAYAVELKPKVVESASARVIAPAGQAPLVAKSCNAFLPIPGGLSQTQLGSAISRADGQLLQPGAYILRIVVDGETADVPFTIK